MRQDCSGICSLCKSRGRQCSVQFDNIISADSSGISVCRNRLTAKPGCLVVSHRGFSYSAPENTISSVEESVRIGADFCEFDVRMTKDGVVVLMHDRTVDRTTNGTGRVDQMSLGELKELDAGSWKGDRYTGEKVATLDRVFERIKPTPQSLLVDIKDDQAVRAVADCVRGHSMEGRAVLLSSDEQVLSLIASFDDRIRRAYLCQSFPGSFQAIPDRVDWLCRKTERLGVDIVDIDYTLVSREMITALHKNNIEVWTWTVNAPEIMQCLIDWGIDAIASDRPDLLAGISSGCKTDYKYALQGKKYPPAKP